MKNLFVTLLAFFTALTQAQTPNFYYEKIQSGYLNGHPVCGFWDPDLFEYCYAPAFFDWDGDGLKDLFFGTTQGKIYYFKNTGTKDNPCFTLITQNFGGITVPYGYAAPFPCDLNGDGKTDFLIGNGISASVGGTVFYFKGDGNMTNPGFQLVESTLAGVDLSDTSVPFAVDIDNDGDLDLFIGDGLGSIVFVENTGTKTSPAWDCPYHIIPDNGLTWRVSPQVVNIRGDAKLELVVAEAYGTLALFNYVGKDSCTVNFQQVPGSFAGIDACAGTGGCLVRPAFVDIDNDGDYDLFIRNINEDKFYFYRNKIMTTEPVLELEDWNFTHLPGFNYALFFADTDKDNKIEMYVPTSNGKVTVYENEGTPAEPNWVYRTDNFLNFTTPYIKSLAFGDVNGDNLPDVMVGHNSNPEFSPKLMLYLNTGNGFVYQPVPFLENYAYGQTALPELADFDADGKMDLLVARNNLPLLHFESADSTGANWQLQADSTFSDISGYKVTAGDVDGDGDLDLLSSWFYYENIGDPENPKFIRTNWSISGVSGSIYYPTLANITDDCGLELFNGGEFYKYRGIQPQIKSISTFICTNSDPVQIKAEPTGVVYTGADSLGWFDPNIPPGYHAVIVAYSGPVGCYPKYDTVWMNVHLAPDATIATINSTPITTDTIYVCDMADIQKLTATQPGGYFTGLNMSQGQFNPATWGLGYHTVINQIYDNGCWDRDSLIIDIQHCTVGTSAAAKKTTFDLAVNPNPFSTAVTFEYTLPHKAIVTLIIADMQGTEVTSLLKGKELSAGKHQNAGDGFDQLAPGAYQVLLWVDGEICSKVIIKQ